jgi:hypothetical protein
MKHHSRRNLAKALAIAADTFDMCNAVASEPCEPMAIGTANIAAVRDARTLILDDGRDAL